MLKIFLLIFLNCLLVVFLFLLKIIEQQKLTINELQNKLNNYNNTINNLNKDINNYRNIISKKDIELNNYKSQLPFMIEFINKQYLSITYKILEIISKYH